MFYCILISQGVLAQTYQAYCQMQQIILKNIEESPCLFYAYFLLFIQNQNSYLLAMGCGIAMTVLQNRSMIQNQLKCPIPPTPHIDPNLSFNHDTLPKEHSNLVQKAQDLVQSNTDSIIVEHHELQKRALNQLQINKEQMAKKQAVQMMKKSQKPKQRYNIKKKDVVVNPKAANKSKINTNKLQITKLEPKGPLAKANQNHPQTQITQIEQKSQTITLQRLPNKQPKQSSNPKIAKTAQPPQVYPQLELPSRQKPKNQKQYIQIKVNQQAKHNEEDCKILLQKQNTSQKRQIAQQHVQKLSNSQVIQNYKNLQQQQTEKPLQDFSNVQTEVKNSHKTEPVNNSIIQKDSQFQQSTPAQNINQPQKQQQQKSKNRIQQKQNNNSKKLKNQPKQAQVANKKIQQEQKKKLEKEAKQIMNIYKI